MQAGGLPFSGCRRLVCGRCLRFCATQDKSSLFTLALWLTTGHRVSTGGHAFVDPFWSQDPSLEKNVRPLRDHLALSVVADNYPEFEPDGSWR